MINFLLAVDPWEAIEKIYSRHGAEVLIKTRKVVWKIWSYRIGE